MTWPWIQPCPWWPISSLLCSPGEKRHLSSLRLKTVTASGFWALLGGSSGNSIWKGSQGCKFWEDQWRLETLNGLVHRSWVLRKMTRELKCLLPLRKSSQAFLHRGSSQRLQDSRVLNCHILFPSHLTGQRKSQEWVRSKGVRDPPAYWVSSTPYYKVCGHIVKSH